MTQIESLSATVRIEFEVGQLWLQVERKQKKKAPKLTHNFKTTFNIQYSKNQWRDITEQNDIFDLYYECSFLNFIFLFILLLVVSEITSFSVISMIRFQ